MSVVISPSTKSDNLKIAAGRHTTVAASDTVQTGLRHVESLVVSLDDDPVDGAQLVTGKIGSAGAVSIKTWKATGDSDATLIAATTFGKKVNWIAVGR